MRGKELHKLKRALTTLLHQSLSERTALTAKKMNYYILIQQDEKL